MACQKLPKYKCPFCGETKDLIEENQFLMKCNQCNANWGCNKWKKA